MIRLATLNDAYRIAEINIYGWRTAYKDLLPETYLYGKLTVVKRYEILLKQFETQDSYFVFEDDQTGLIKAFMVISDSRDPQSSLEKSSLPPHELIAIYVEPAFKGQGIGSQMIKYFEQIAINLQKSNTIIWVLKDNLPSIRFYEKHGYHFDGNIKIFDPFGLEEVRYSKALKG
ncbi:N-acetyltransferase family protein [Fusibacter bizertensis]